MTSEFFSNFWGSHHRWVSIFTGGRVSPDNPYGGVSSAYAVFSYGSECRRQWTMEQ